MFNWSNNQKGKQNLENFTPIFSPTSFFLMNIRTLYKRKQKCTAKNEKDSVMARGMSAKRKKLRAAIQ